jgi:hypothetical protein
VPLCPHGTTGGKRKIIDSVHKRAPEQDSGRNLVYCAPYPIFIIPEGGHGGKWRAVYRYCSGQPEIEIIKEQSNNKSMNFTKLVPSVFYIDISDGLKLFVDCLQFSIEHKDLNTSQPYCVLEKDGIRIMLFQDEKLAKEHYPELRIETENIEEVYSKISNSHPQLLHPNLNKVTLRPWGAKEFAIKDKQIGIRFQQW